MFIENGSVVQLAPSTRGAALSSRVLGTGSSEVLMFYVYILQSLADKSFYIGFTKNTVTRLNEHNSGKSTYTRKKIPWKLVYTEKYESKSEAIKREKFLKSQRNTDFYKKLIDNLDR